MSSLRLSMLISLLIILLVIKPCFSAGVNAYNNIVIRSSSIEWLYFAPRLSHDIKNIVLDMDKYGLRYQYLRYNARGSELKHSYATSIRLSMVFIGNERIYYNFVYKYQDNTISVDSNIIMDEKYIVIQWFNVETKIRNIDISKSINVSRYYNVFPYRNIVIKYQGVNLTASINYAYTKLQSVNGLILEEIGVYDISIDKEYIAKDLMGHNNINYYNINMSNLCLNITYIPMYAWIDVSLGLSDKQESLIVIINGLNSSDIDNAFKTIPCMLSILNLSLSAVQNLGLANIYEEVSRTLKVSIINETTKLIQTYVYDKLGYQRLIHTLYLKYDMVDPRIKIHVNQSTYNVSFYIVLQDQKTIRMLKEDTVNVFKELVNSIPIPNFGIDSLQEALHNANVIDTRTPTPSAESGLRISPQYFITVVVLVLVSIQVVILIYTIIRIYKHWKSLG
ncbi:MAG: hypothetical protein QXL96_05025 [Ignisphaera sp.]